MLELLFVGAGPHSLATLTRLLEPNPDPGVDAPQRHVNAKAKVTHESVWVSATWLGNPCQLMTTNHLQLCPLSLPWRMQHIT